MKTLHTTAHIGPAGALTLNLPAVPDMAGAVVDVLVVLSPVAVNGTSQPTPITPIERAAWKKVVEQTAGQWHGEFVRPDQGEFEERADWP